jgi:hypothetical protein
VVTGKAKQLDKLEEFLAWIQYCGNVGHSGTAELSVDGDGAARLKIDKVTGKATVGEYEAEAHEPLKAKDNYEAEGDGPELTVGID